MMIAMFGTTKESIEEIQNQIGLSLKINPITKDRLYSVAGETCQVMRLIGRFADNGEDCLIKAEVL